MYRERESLAVCAVYLGTVGGRGGGVELCNVQVILECVFTHLAARGAVVGPYWPYSDKKSTVYFCEFSE